MLTMYYNRLTSLNLRDDTTQPVVSRVHREQAIVLKVQTIDLPSHTRLVPIV